MKITKLKKSLSIIYLTKISLNSSFFILSEKKDSASFDLSYTFLKLFAKQFNLNDLKYPLTLMIITNLSQILAFSSPFFLVNFKEFFVKTQSNIIFYSLNGLNVIGNLEKLFFFTADYHFYILTLLNRFHKNLSPTQ